MSYTSFIRYLKYQKRYSPHTLKAYQQDLRAFSQYLQDTYDMDFMQNGDAVTGIRHSHIRSWMVHLLEQGATNRTINRKLSALKTFFRFLLRENVLKQSPMDKVQPPKMRQELPVYVEERHMALLLGKVDFGQGFVALRDRLVLELLYATGLRVGELANLPESACDIGSAQLKVLGKRNKERIIPVGADLIKLVQAYLQAKKETFKSAADTLLVTDKGKPVYVKLIYRTVRKYLDMVTSIEKRSPHVLRHTFATHLSNKGAELNAIKELLGHANLAATQIYTHNTIEKLKNVYQQAHPRAQKR